MKKLMKCRHVQAKLLLFQEGELEPREAAEVRDHLRDCPRCAALAEELSATMQQVESALHTTITAPPTLDARVMATVRRLPARRLQWPAFTPPWSWQRRLVTAGAALSLMLAGFVAGRAPSQFPGQDTPSRPDPQPTARITAPETAVLQLASLRSDHLQSLISPRAVTVMGDNPQQVAQSLGRKDDCVVTPVSLASAGTKLLGGRWHRVAGVPVAFLCYEWNGQRISLYQTDGRRLTLPALRVLAQQSTADGERCYVVKQEGSLTYVAWCSGTTNYILVAQATPERLLQLARQATLVSRNA